VLFVGYGLTRYCLIQCFWWGLRLVGIIIPLKDLMGLYRCLRACDGLDIAKPTLLYYCRCHTGIGLVGRDR